MGKQRLTTAVSMRFDQEILEKIEEWRSNMRPIPSRSSAVRKLVARSIVIETILPQILETSLSRLLAEGVISAASDSESYKRLSEVILGVLEETALQSLKDDENLCEPDHPSEIQKRSG